MEKQETISTWQSILSRIGEFQLHFLEYFQRFYNFVMTCLLGKYTEKALELLEVPLMYQKFILRSFFFNKIKRKKV